jgi:4-amino-4-deoxy-L-arabinose transferase-like glycosyltransferase
MIRFTSRDALCCVALFVYALVYRAVFLIQQPFDGLYGQDAYAYFNFAGDLQHALLSGSAPPPFFWGLGYPSLLMAIFALFGTSAYVGQAASILLGAALAPLVYLLARLLDIDRLGAFICGLLLAFCGQAAQSSLVIMADIPALFLATLSALFLLIYLRRKRGFLWLIVAALCLTVAILSRWLYVLLLIPFIVLYISERGAFRHTVIAALAAMILFFPQIAYSLTNPYPTFNHAWVEGWSPVNAFERDFVNVDGEFHYALPNWQFYGGAFTDPYYLAPMFLLFAVIGLFTLRRRYGLFLGLWAFLPYLFLIGIPYQNIRFPLIVVPATALACGAGAAWIIGKLQTFVKANPSTRRFGKRWAIIAMAAICAVGLAMMISSGQQTIPVFLANQQRDKTATTWATEQLPATATVYTMGLTLTLQHYTDLDSRELYYETVESLRENASRGDYLLINVWQIENQWNGREPQFAYHYLRDQRGLSEIGRNGNYTLFRIES